MAAQLESAEYATQAEVNQAAQLRDWLRALEQRSTMTSRDPVLLVAAARCGVDAAFREQLRGAIALIEQALHDAS